MTHSPYSDWLFMRESLTPEERERLEAHLQSCPDCAALDASLQSLDGRLRAAARPEPLPGFADRWLVAASRRLEAASRRQQRILLTLWGAGWLLTLAALALVWWRSPALPLVNWAAGLARWSQVGLAARVLGRTFFSVAPLPAWLLLAGVSLGWALTLGGLGWRLGRALRPQISG